MPTIAVVGEVVVERADPVHRGFVFVITLAESEPVGKPEIREEASCEPGLSWRRVADLLDILKITKQSLARVLKQLLESGHIVQKTGSTDRRKRLLYPTQRGRELVVRLSRPQSRRIHAAIGQTGQENEAAIRQFLAAMSKPG